MVATVCDYCFWSVLLQALCFSDIDVVKQNDRCQPHIPAFFCIYCCQVIAYEKTRMDGLCPLDSLHRGCGRSLRLFDPKGQSNLHPDCRQAASVTPRHRISHRLGHSLCPHGHRRRPHLSRAPLRRPVQESAAVFAPAGLQLLLEHHLLQPPGLWLCPDLAGPFVGADCVHGARLLEGGQNRRLAADPLSSVGDLCGLSQLRRMAAQLNSPKVTAAEAAVSFLPNRYTFVTFR